MRAGPKAAVTALPLDLSALPPKGWKRIDAFAREYLRVPKGTDAGGHARGIEDQPEPIDVEVRVEWAEDGEEWLRGLAHRWTKSHVFVRFQDSRSPTGFVWVRARDVGRL